MRIVFWSPMHGSGASAGATACAVALAASGQKILLTQTQYTMNNVEIPFLPPDTGPVMLEERGMDRLIRSYKAGHLSTSSIREESIMISENLWILPGGRQRAREIYDDRHTREIENRVLELAHETVGNTIVELNPGYSQRTMKQIAASDILVICVSQDNRMLTELMRDGQIPKGKKKTVFLLGMYDRKSRYVAHYYTSRYALLRGQKLFKMPYLSDFRDAINSCGVYDFLSEGLECDWAGDEKYFFTNVRQFADEIGESL